ncbi:hypothetical protein I316_03606 [Kwoniella heveanensis BCC8398]|uniref:cellulase n=1 Tax=Kwoniella heveanensis BCC8398 TaxID=1296120 RepID=A0A1B9GUL7_9TREE|nr:hypothetical protein I316_03606 [Kwoniella heveanensis BCC8398]
MLLNTLLPLLGLLSLSMAAPLVHPKRALPRLGGVNLAGCDFGMNTDGWSGTTYCPGTEQIAHFANKGANIFRLPVGWQYLVGSTTDSSSKALDATYFAKYDNLVQASLATGAYVMIDLHNYARWNGQIVGQGGPSDANLASLWSLVAKKYANQPKIIFGIMNEPHDVDVSVWATTVQASVNAIRAAGAITQSIALPGYEWTHPEAWSRGSNDPLLNVKDPVDASGSLLIIDAHKYYDSDGSGTNAECTTNGVQVFTEFRTWLQKVGRKAIISETGGGNTASCQTAVGEAIKYISSNTDVFIGFTIWSAGSFDSSYVLSITPNGDTDNQLFVKAVQPYLPGSSGSTPAPASSSKAVSTVVSSSSMSQAASSSATSAKASTTSSTGRSTSSPAGSSSAVRTSTTAKPSTTASSVTSTVRSSTTAKSTTFASTSAKPTTSTSAKTSSTTSAAAVPPATTSAVTGSGGLQTFKGALGGIAAPAVTASGNQYTTSGRTFNFLVDALNASCYAQMDKCQSAANSSGNKGDLTVNNCNGQVQECLKMASSTSA